MKVVRYKEKAMRILMKKSAKAPRYPSSKSWERVAADLQTKTDVVSSFIQFRLEFREHNYSPTSQAIGIEIYLGNKRNFALLFESQDQNLEKKNL